MAPIKLILFFIFFQFGIVFSQTIELGVPYCQNITPKEIGYGGAMYTISQNKLGTLCFGNFNGLLFYNGSRWRMQTWNGKPILHQSTNNQIFIGGFNTIAECKLDEYNRNVFESLIDTVYDFGQIEKILVYQNRVYFVANKTLYYISNNQPKSYFPIHVFYRYSAIEINCLFLHPKGCMSLKMKKLKHRISPIF